MATILDVIAAMATEDRVEDPIVAQYIRDTPVEQITAHVLGKLSLRRPIAEEPK